MRPQIFTVELLDDLKNLNQIARSCYGPAGNLKVFVQGLNEIRLTSSSLRLLPHSSAIATTQGGKLVAEIARRQNRNFGDGGLRVLQLATCLTLMALQCDALTIRHINRGFRKACMCATKWLKFIDRSACKILWSELPDIIVLVKNIFHSKPLVWRVPSTLHYKDFFEGRRPSLCDTKSLLASLTLRAFLMSLAKVHGGPSDTLDSRIRYLPIVGNALSQTAIFPRTIHLDVPTSIIFRTSNLVPRHQARAVVVALFDVEIWPVPRATNATRCRLAISVGPKYQNRRNCRNKAMAARKMSKHTEFVILRRIFGIFVTNGVGFVGSQKTIHPWLQKRLAEAGITVLSRLSLKNMKLIQQLSGARVLSTGWASGGIPIESLGAIYQPCVHIGRRVGSEENRSVLFLQAASEVAIGALSKALHIQRRKVCRLSDADHQATCEEFRRGVLRRRSSLITFTVAALDQNTAQEIVCNIEGAFAVLKNALIEQRIFCNESFWERMGASFYHHLNLDATNEYSRSHNKFISGNIDSSPLVLRGVDIFAVSLKGISALQRRCTAPTSSKYSESLPICISIIEAAAQGAANALRLGLPR